MNRDLVLALRWLVTKYRSRAAESGHYVVARQLRKQGVPLVVARILLFGKV
jgi:hypothetical protein